MEIPFGTLALWGKRVERMRLDGWDGEEVEHASTGRPRFLTPTEHAHLLDYSIPELFPNQTIHFHGFLGNRSIFFERAQSATAGRRPAWGRASRGGAGAAFKTT